MWQDPDLWLVMLSLATSAVAVGMWLRAAGDDWLTGERDDDRAEVMHDEGRTNDPW